MDEMNTENAKKETKLEEEIVAVEAESEDSNVESIDSKKEEKEEENFKDKYYYLAAEMDNMRRRFDREKEGLIKYGNERILKSLLDVVDNLERTLVAVQNEEDEKIKNIIVGVDMVSKQFVDVLKENGLEEVKALGEKFDPNFHEAMAKQSAEDKDDEEIIMEYQKGYTLNGRLIRASKVVIAKKD